MENPRCIFCQCEGDVFHTIEHIVPESLGNTDDILENAVCDKCQNYLGREIENYVLSKTPFGFWRTMAGTPSKKGKPPMFNPSQKPSTSGKTFDFHPFTDNGFVIHPMNGESIRPHAKLSKAVKVADTSDQGEAESKALSPVAVTLGEDTKPFDKTDGVFNKDTFS